VRLFLALEPSAPFRQAVATRVAELKGSLPAASWVRPSNLHLTLLFLGEVEEPELPNVVRTFESARAEAPAEPISVGGAGGFPEQGRVRVVWLGLEPARALAAIASAYRAAAAAARLAFDSKPFRPHLTLARCRAPWPGALRARLPELAPPAAPPFRAESAALLSSVLGPGGATYTPRARFALAEAA
jgi:2'-5' RNA ligase